MMTEDTNLYQDQDDRLPSCYRAQAGGTALTAGSKLPTFTVILLLIAVTLSLLQKYWERQAAIGVATQLPTATVASEIHRAEVVQLIGVSTALLAIGMWGWAFYRKESTLVLHLSLLTLLTIFLLMQLLMV
ncbi:MAG: hypothetical protein ACQESR_18320 [Planctomycetota bacterium]